MTWDRLGALMGEADELIEAEIKEELYESFLASKTVTVEPRGIASKSMGSHMTGFRKHCVEFAMEAASSGLFLDTGLGKTSIELEFCLQALEESNGKALIMTPLAVARQIEKEALRWGYPARVIRSQDDAKSGINICNYDRLPLLVPEEFGVVALDESSILKNFTGKTTRSLIDAFAGHRWRLAATATPAPNDHMELGNHSEFLRVMPMNDMLVRWFINDASDTGTWRLKGHARQSFWDWMASWCRMAEHPRDLGDPMEGFDLPPLNVIRHQADSSDVKGDEGTLFANPDISATGIFKVKKQTADARAKAARGIVDSKPSEPWLIWCDTDSEQTALENLFSDIGCVSVKGSQSIDQKESGIASWIDDGGVIISKPSILGYGMNFQFCSKQVFVGRTFSYETWYQAVRRSWRFGQKKPVDIHLIVAEGEDSIGRVIDRKADDHQSMKREMAGAMRRAMGLSSMVRNQYNPQHSGRLPRWFNA